MMEAVKDTKGFAVKLWSQWYRQFNKHFHRCGLGPDLNQTIELSAIRTKGMDKRDCSSHIQKDFRELLKENGFRKVDGRWVLREFQFSQEVWNKFHKTSLITIRDWEKG